MGGRGARQGGQGRPPPGGPAPRGPGWLRTWSLGSASWRHLTTMSMASRQLNWWRPWLPRCPLAPSLFTHSVLPRRFSATWGAGRGGGGEALGAGRAGTLAAGQGACPQAAAPVHGDG
jgi:hypothetical protein